RFVIRLFITYRRWIVVHLTRDFPYLNVNGFWHYFVSFSIFAVNLHKYEEEECSRKSFTNKFVKLILSPFKNMNTPFEQIKILLEKCEPEQKEIIFKQLRKEFKIHPIE